MITYKQLTLAEIFEDCQNKFDNDKYRFLSLLDEAINLDEIVPLSFVSHFHASIGRPRRHKLFSMLKALLLQRIFSIPTDTLLIVFLKYSQELRDFCGFDVVPDGSKFTRFKQDFLLDLQSIQAHPDIVVGKKSDSPDEDKSLADSKALLPVLIDFFQKHPLIQPKTFLGDAAFDSIEIYKSFLNEVGFQKAFIPLKTKISIEGIDYTVNENGIPCCPHDPSLPMKREGSKSHLRSKLPTMKFVCPKMKWEYNPADKSKRRVCHCDNPCTSSSCGRMIYIYPEKNLRAYPGVERGSQEWEDTYKIRVNVEKSINHFKDSFCIANRKTQNEKTLHADLLLAGITQLVTVLVADKIHQHQYIRSLKTLIA